MTCFDCEMHITKDLLERFNKEFGDMIFPLDTEWAHCISGPDTWLNCRTRKRPLEEFDR